MHNAPPVVYPVGRFVWGQGLACVLAMLAVCVMAWQAGSSGAPALTRAGAVWLALMAGCALLCSRELLQEGELVWDGTCWHVVGTSGVDGPAALRLSFDGGHFMLVSMLPLEHKRWDSLPRYACLRRADMPSHWHGFRCAVYSRRMDSGT